ncbi:MAG TPA: PDZ domain-containing protein [Candidatus Limnocylindrales bacterium]|nr:PDZ domain-containing protein [Candidatus Limnocylindrales bacterium]
MPFKVGPIPTGLELVVGKEPKGAAITELTDAGKAADLGLLVGDIIIKMNATDIDSPATFEKALENVPQQVLLSVRRPQIRMTSTRLLKIKYEVTEAAAEGASAIGSEKLDIEVLEVTLPFQDQVEKTRQTHELWQPTAADLEGLKKNWFELPARSPAVFTKGTHRVVAAANFDDALSSDRGLAKAKFAIVMDFEGNPMRGGGKSIDIYGFEAVGKDAMDGTYVTATIASAPFPINIEFKGRFQMVKVDDWSDKDTEARKSKKAQPKEDLNKYEVLPDTAPSQPKKQ